MSNEKNVEEKYLYWATEALNNGEHHDASTFYEKYANKILFQDNKKAAFYYDLAAQYCGDNKYAISLLQKSLNLNVKIDNKYDVIETLLSMALKYQNMKNTDLYNSTLCKCMSYCFRYSQSIVCCDNKLTLEIKDNLEDVQDKISFCISNLKFTR